MKLLLLQGQGYRLIDPGTLDEAGFTAIVEVALCQLFPSFWCVPFTGTFDLNGNRNRPDLALIAQDFTHWFIVEVELTSHSLDGHVLPQVRTLRYGEPQDDCANILSRRLDVELGVVQSLVHYVPRSVVVIAEARKSNWAIALGAHDIQLMAIAPYESGAGKTALAVEGSMFVTAESLGIGKYSVTDRSFRLPLVAPLPDDGRIQIEDPSGAVAWWVIRRTRGVAWITREVSGAEVEHDAYVQLIRTMDGRLSLRAVS